MKTQRDVMLSMNLMNSRPEKLTAIAVLCVILLFNFVTAKFCDTTDILVDINNQCPDTQICDQTSSTCKCRPGYKLKNETFCVADETQLPHNQAHNSTPNHSSLVSSNGSGSIIAGILIPLTLILLVIYAVYVNRKYNLVNWFRSKIYQRNNNYDEFMIGQDQDDDPPIA